MLHFTLTALPAVLVSSSFFAAIPVAGNKTIISQKEDSTAFESKKVEQTEIITLNGDIKNVFPLFGAFEERKWAEGWNPVLVYPSTEVIAIGTTFKTESHGQGEPDYTWRVNQYDEESGLIQYLVFTPNRYWTITIQCSKLPENKTLARVTYSFIGLNKQGNYLNEHHLGRIFDEHLKDWEQAINAYLDSSKQYK